MSNNEHRNDEHDHTIRTEDLPSKAKLIKSTLLAIVLAAVILVTVVLPAEYGIDPTGLGKVLGLTKMGEIKTSLSEEAAEDRSHEADAQPEEAAEVETTTEPEAEIEGEEAPVAEEVAMPSEEMSITLTPNEGKEIKLTMNKGAKVDFVWWTNNGKANFDLHADSKALSINYHSYKKGSLERDEGILEADFDGKHGWFWRNRTDQAMTVTLQVSGDFSDIQELK